VVGPAERPLVAEVAHLEPGKALDVGCGEGADAIWLAQRGGTVTALDPSAVALARAAATAAALELTVAWMHGGLVETASELGTFDLVSVQYGVLPADAETTAIRLLCRAVAPGGTLLVVHHELDLMADHHGVFDPADHVMPDDVAAHLQDERQASGRSRSTNDAGDQARSHPRHDTSATSSYEPAASQRRRPPAEPRPPGGRSGHSSYLDIDRVVGSPHRWWGFVPLLHGVLGWRMK
jgi:SAM-dependent methyltransferase